MDDSEKTKEQLIQELAELRARVAEIESGSVDGIREDETYHCLFDDFPQGVAVFQDEYIVYANQTLAKQTGYSIEEMLSRSPEEIQEFFHPEDRAQVQQHRQDRLEGKPAPEHYEFRAIRKDGTKIWMELFANRIEYHGRPAIRTTCVDITDRKQMEEALQFTQFALDHAADATFWTGSDAHFIYVNKKACRSLGFTQEELLSMTVHDIDPDFPTEDWPNHWKEIRQRGSFTIESHHRAKDGRIFPVEVTVNYLEYRGKEYNCAFARDTTDRKQVEEALRKSEERYRTLVETSPMGIWHCDGEGKTIYVNPAMCALLEVRNPEELSGLAWQSFFTAESLKTIAGEHGKRLKGLSSSYEAEMVGKHGKKHSVVVRGSPLLSADGELEGTIGTFLDITERKRLEDQLRQAQKMEAVGQLAGGVAHDFNNLLTGIIGNLSLAKMGAPEQIGKYLQAANNAADRAAKLVRQLLAFSRKSAIQLGSVDLNRVVNEVHDLARQTIDRRIEIAVHTEEDLPSVRADAAQIHSILMNLCVNARDAIAEVMHGQAAPGRRGDRFLITLETESALIEDRYCKDHSYARPGRFVVVSVSDNGAGMDEETQRHIFEPFFTTKEIGQGTGLGLASAYGIIKQHDGWINIYSEPGEGTTFKIYLPVAEEEREEIRTEPKEEIPGGNETILLVDDEELIRNLGQTILESYGYTTLLAADGEEGLNMFLKERDRIDLIVLDLSMPRLSGREALHQLHTVAPDVKVIVSSGYSENGQAEALWQLGAAGYVGKPYHPPDLARKVREVLDAPNPRER